MDRPPVLRDNPRALASDGLSLRTGGRTMLYLTCSMILSVDLHVAWYLRLKIWVSGD